MRASCGRRRVRVDVGGRAVSQLLLAIAYSVVVFGFGFWLGARAVRSDKVRGKLAADIAAELRKDIDEAIR